MKSSLIPVILASAAAGIQVLPHDLSVSNSNKRDSSSSGGGLDSQQCMDALTSLLPLATSVPTPPPALSSALQDITITDPCRMPTDLPADVSSSLSSYTSTLLDWYSSHSSDIEGALSQCPEFTSYMSDAPVCTTDVGGLGAATAGGSGADATSGGAAAAATGAGSSSSPSSSGSSSGSGSGASGGNANGMFLAATVAAVGFIAGVIAI